MLSMYVICPPVSATLYLNVSYVMLPLFVGASQKARQLRRAVAGSNKVMIRTGGWECELLTQTQTVWFQVDWRRTG